MFKNNQNILKSVSDLIEENAKLNKLAEEYAKEKAKNIKAELAEKFEMINGYRFISAIINLDASTIKDIAFQLKSQYNDLFFIIGSEINGKASLTVALSDDLINNKGLNASVIIREISKEINGGGGGQPFFATAGGTNTSGIPKAIEKAKDYLK